jgi:hypothetical protein
MTGWGSELKAYEMETPDEDFDISIKKKRESEWNEQEGEW